LLVSLVLAVGIVWLALHSRYLPFVFFTDRLGQVITISELLMPASMAVVAVRMQRCEIQAFINDARSLSSDPAVEQERLTSLHAHARCVAGLQFESDRTGNCSPRHRCSEICPTWGKLYRNSHFGKHFGAKKLWFSGLSQGF
jgi:type IV secretory pathway TrbF-like protein